MEKSNGFKKPLLISISIILALVATIYAITVNGQAKINEDLKAQAQGATNSALKALNDVATLNSAVARIDERTANIERQLTSQAEWLKNLLKYVPK